MEELEQEIVEPPGTGGPSNRWSKVSTEEWQDWRWQLRHRLSTPEEIAQVISLTPDEERALRTPGHFRVALPPYVADLMDPLDPTCPIRRQVIPTMAELAPAPEQSEDPLGEEAHSPVPGLVHRYPDRVLLLVTTQCAAYCRFCTRSRLVGDPHAHPGREHAQQLAYIARNPQVRDVLVSGGDPLLLPTPVLEEVLQGLRAIPHVEVIRIGSRVPIFLPQRVTPELVEMLRRYHPLWMNVHVNHPKELTPTAAVALARLADAGIPLGSQTVLLAGINDCPSLMMELFRQLVRHRVRPYYLYQCDMVQGAGHFRTPVAKGIEIMEALRGHTSGFALPTFTIDAPGGGGKVPILPTYLLSMSDRFVVVRNYEGMVSTYAQPERYTPHDADRCPYCRAHRGEGGQEGIAALLAGQRQTLVPEGWTSIHRREVWTSVQPIPTVERRED